MPEGGTMLYALALIALIVLVVWQGKRAQRLLFEEKKVLYKRPIWNILNRQPEPLMCLQINRELEKILSLPKISDSELYNILDEMVREGILVVTIHERAVRELTAKVRKYAIAPGSDPPKPPREDPEDAHGFDLTPKHT
jgi:hypothetical protein